LDQAFPRASRKRYADSKLFCDDTELTNSAMKDGFRKRLVPCSSIAKAHAQDAIVRSQEEAMGDFRSPLGGGEKMPPRPLDGLVEVWVCPRTGLAERHFAFIVDRAPTVKLGEQIAHGSIRGCR